MKIKNTDPKQCTDRNHRCKSHTNLHGNLDQKYMKCQNAENVMERMHESKSVAHKRSKVSCKSKRKISLLLQVLSRSHSEVHAVILLDFEWNWLSVQSQGKRRWYLGNRRFRSVHCLGSMFFIFIGVSGWVGIAGASHMRQKNHSEEEKNICKMKD